MTTQSLIPRHHPAVRERHQQRQMAKVGMGAAMVTLVCTGLVGGRTLKQVHLVAGMALLGFTFWHWQLNQPVPRLTSRHTPEEMDDDRKPQ
ncbi:MAG: hypothetical protein G8237_02865 [Magnetococcales bacterium]|nr:hypothetical protein [Magnetococcales bacterium]